MIDIKQGDCLIDEREIPEIINDIMILWNT